MNISISWLYLSTACVLPGKSPAWIPTGRPHRRTVWSATEGLQIADHWPAAAVLQSMPYPPPALQQSWQLIR